jgi:hypothetical protein
MAGEFVLYLASDFVVETKIKIGANQQRSGDSQVESPLKQRPTAVDQARDNRSILGGRRRRSRDAVDGECVRSRGAGAASIRRSQFKLTRLRSLGRRMLGADRGERQVIPQGHEIASGSAVEAFGWHVP